MSNTSRIEELRRRLDHDPTSIAFAQLAEECRRVGRTQEAIEVCQRGLARHPGYLSARVTLGRALFEAGQLDAAQRECEFVRAAAPDNLAALRCLAELQQAKGNVREALALFTVALGLARNDPDLQRTVAELSSVVPLSPAMSVQPGPGPIDHSKAHPAARSLAALERWLEAIHALRAQPRA